MKSRTFTPGFSNETINSGPQPQLKKASIKIIDDLNIISGHELIKCIVAAESSKDNRDFRSLAEQSFDELKNIPGLRFPEKDELLDYLDEYKELFTPLVFAAVASVEEFGTSSQISVELYRDPEIYDRYIVVYVRQYSYDDDIMDRIDMICNEYEKYISDTDGWMMITTDFKPPAD